MLLRTCRGWLGAAGIVILMGAYAAGAAGPAQAAVGDAQSFNETVFRSTHNSYSGNIQGNRGSITAQLDRGSRFVEFDVQDNDYDVYHDYQLGHDARGDEVDHTGGNPSSDNLSDWLAVVATWSRAHSSAAPIVVMVDLKDDLTDNFSHDAGNLVALNLELKAAFGTQLVTAATDPSRKTIGSLRGKVLTVLSGDQGTRTSYKRDVGFHPAIAINDQGDVVEVHDSGAGHLWYWTGKYGSDGLVSWLRHGRYDTGRTPAVTLNDDGKIVEVHQSENHTTLWSHVGQLSISGGIDWGPSAQYDNGVTPTARFTSLTASTVTEIHRSQNHDQNWTRAGSADAPASGIHWQGIATTTAQSIYPTDISTHAGRTVSVSTAANGATPAETLRYSTPAVVQGLIRYPQVAFDEYQAGDGAELKQDAVFYAAPADDTSFIESSRRAGHLVRAWDFDPATDVTAPLANYPATNKPGDDRYQQLMNTTGAVS